MNDKEVQRKVGTMVHSATRDWPLDMCALYFGQVFAEFISGGRSSDGGGSSANGDPGSVGLG